MREHDPVAHPRHYTQSSSIECIDAIEAALGPEGFQAYCRGTAIKYSWRAGLKDDAQQDMEKGAWYLSRGARAEVREPLPSGRSMEAFLSSQNASLQEQIKAQERQFLDAQDSLRSEWLKIIDALAEMVPAIPGETTHSMVRLVKEKVTEEITELRDRNADLIRLLDAALASIQDVHSILGTEIANEGIRLVAMRIKGERDEAKAELEFIDAILGNRQVFDSCRSRAEKVGLAIRCASRGESLGPA